MGPQTQRSSHQTSGPGSGWRSSPGCPQGQSFSCCPEGWDICRGRRRRKTCTLASIACMHAAETHPSYSSVHTECLEAGETKQSRTRKASVGDGRAVATSTYAASRRGRDSGSWSLGKKDVKDASRTTNAHLGSSSPPETRQSRLNYLELFS